MLKTVALDKNKVELLFQESDHQSNIIIGLYKMVYPEWNNIQSVNGFPTINEYTNNQLFELFIEFDKKHHPEVYAGGAWLNNGFSSVNSDDLDDWTVLPVNVTLVA